MAGEILFAELPWYWGVGLCCLGGGIAGLANNLADAIPELVAKPSGSTVYWELARGILIGAVAGLVGAGTLRPADPVALLVAATLSGWLGETYISKLASQMLTKAVEDSTKRVSGAIGPGDNEPAEVEMPDAAVAAASQMAAAAADQDIHVTSPEEAERILKELKAEGDIDIALATLDELIAKASSGEERGLLQELRVTLLQENGEEGTK